METETIGTKIMQISARHFISPFAAVVTLATGIAVVAAITPFFSLFGSSPVVANEAPVIVRPWDNTDPVKPQKLELSCYDLNILPIWLELKGDGEFKKWVDGESGTYDCSQLLEVKSVDLNSDGFPEVLARGKGLLRGLQLTGCGFWVFDGRTHNIIFSGQDFGDTPDIDDVVRKSRTRGYSDLLIMERVSGIETIYSTYSFNGEQYSESRCMYQVMKNEDHRTEGDWELVPCKEYESRSNN